MRSALDLLYSKQSASRFLEVNDILMQAMLTNMDVALVDMPELLLRMKIASTHSLEDL